MIFNNRTMKRLIILLFIITSTIACKKSIVKSENSNKKEGIGSIKHFRPDKNTHLEKIAFGSCSRQNMDQQYLNVIASKNPDLWIWMGDIIYSDTENMDKHKTQYDVMKNNPIYQNFISKTPVIGIWDDHDYGVNDGDKTYPKKEESKELFLDFLDISDSASVRQHKGVYTTYEFGKDHRKVKIYLLDNRTFKDVLKDDSSTPNRYANNMTGTILGEEQWIWLEEEINKSDATINIFVSGLQIIPDDHIYEKWGNFPNERLKFLDLLEKTKVKNPIIFSGDRHFAELSEYTYMDFSAKVMELTSSGLTHSYEGVQEINAYRLGYLFDEKNFGMYNISWSGSKVLIKLYIYDINGKEIFQHGIITNY